MRKGPAQVNGVTVMPEFFQVEGVEAVLDNLQRRARVDAIATSPYVMAPAPDGTGGRGLVAQAAIERGIGREARRGADGQLAPPPERPVE
ncbi:MAG: hypothetical protein ACKOUS_17200, partial [Alphaproteobacteria bacterium]